MSEATLLPPETEDGPARIRTAGGNVIELEKVQSTRASALAYDEDASALFVMFPNGNVYEYEGVEQDVFESCITAESIGKFMNEKIIGPRGGPKPYPYREVQREDPTNTEVAPTAATSVALPVTQSTASPTEIVPVVRELPAKDEDLKALALATLQSARSLIVRDAQNRIIIRDADAFRGAERGLVSAKVERARIWDRLQKIVEPAHKAWKFAVALRDEAVGPYDQAEKELKEAMLQFHRAEDARRREAEQAERKRLEAQAAEDARIQAQEEADREAVYLESQGAPEEAAQVRANPLPLAPAPVAEVVLPSTVPSSGATSKREKWTFEVIGDVPLSHEFYTLDEKKLLAYAKRTNKHAKVPGVRFWDEGTITTGRAK